MIIRCLNTGAHGTIPEFDFSISSSEHIQDEGGDSVAQRYRVSILQKNGFYLFIKMGNTIFIDDIEFVEPDEIIAARAGVISLSMLSGGWSTFSCFHVAQAF